MWTLLYMVFLCKCVESTLIGDFCTRPSSEHVLESCIELTSVNEPCYAPNDCIESCLGLCEINQQSVLLFPCTLKFACAWKLKPIQESSNNDNYTTEKVIDYKTSATIHEKHNASYDKNQIQETIVLGKETLIVLIASIMTLIIIIVIVIFIWFKLRGKIMATNDTEIIEI